ncbi:Phosphopantetheine adenylyltransferase [Syntrophobotulus glycolicus DSM 8271]|uniref:Phosphopantetheine adenylyltransferase n=1 Tax=Syntrophobotulus glycolicus (strain DSM 8271 / FlGlyR) TaxID=645991 RepID=F0SZ04_SYNGF|nr:pantetheine-phosphate adenylyltransferase [Syntrophobotulus glycolicus]ADY56041.1 Phosphopantetheine adenylyltransferase [Syntrophobotulus glycolicus DSM 8271]
MRIAVYPGTFDPVTLGHMDILHRAAQLFDKIIIGVAANSNKETLFSLEERQELLKHEIKEMSNVEVCPFSGLTVEFARQCGAVALIRGLRAISDFEYEFQLALMNKKLAPDMETVFLMTKSEYSFISSSAIKWAASLKGSISEFVPPNVEKALLKKLH